MKLKELPGGEIHFMRIAVCETQIEYQEYLRRLLEQIYPVKNQAEVAYYSVPEWLVSDISLRTDIFDIAIISRELGLHNGVYIAKEVLKQNDFCQVIIICEKNRILPEYYEIEHTCILPKEYVPMHLVTAVHKALENLSALECSFFMVTSSSTKILIPCREVLYLERVQRKTHIVTSRETIETYQSPQEILATVKSADFVQCHRSIYINLKKVTRMLPGEFMLERKITVPIGRQYAAHAKEAFAQFVNALYLKSRIS